MKCLLFFCILLTFCFVKQIYASEVMIKSFPNLSEHLENIPGFNELKYLLNKRSISIKDQEKIFYWTLSQNSSEALKGLLLYGPPGTGKSTIVKILKKIMHCDHLIEASPAELQTPNQVKNCFEAARKLAQNSSSSKVILFLDEIDDSAKMDSPVLNELLIQTTHKENNKIFIIAATNYKKKLAPAFIRSGRFDIHVLVPLPTGPSRAILLSEELENMIKNNKVNLMCDEIIKIIKFTKGYSTSDITAMVKLAKIISESKNKTHLDFKDFIQSIKLIKRQIHSGPLITSKL